MVFWGTVLKPEQSSSLKPEEGKVLHLSQVCLDAEALEGAASTVFVERKGERFAVASLREGTRESCQLDLFVDGSAGETLVVIGTATVSVTGYLEAKDGGEEQEAYDVAVTPQKAGKVGAETLAKVPAVPAVTLAKRAAPEIMGEVKSAADAEESAHDEDGVSQESGEEEDDEDDEDANGDGGDDEPPQKKQKGGEGEPNGNGKGKGKDGKDGKNKGKGKGKDGKGKSKDGKGKSKDGKGKSKDGKGKGKSKGKGKGKGKGKF